MQVFQTIMLVAVIIYAVFLLAFALKTKRPLKTLMLSALLGIAALLCVNLTSGLTGVALNINGWTLTTSLAAGIPGVLAMLTLRILWGI